MTNVISRQCRTLSGALRDVSQLWREVVHPWMVQHWRLQFDTAGGHGGRPWAPLEPKYAAAQQGDSLTPLEVNTSARLEPSFVDPVNPAHFFSSSKNAMQAGSPVPYAGTLGTGGIGPFGESYPARDPREVTPQQLDALRAEIYAWFRGRL